MYSYTLTKNFSWDNGDPLTGGGHAPCLFRTNRPGIDMQTLAGILTLTSEHTANGCRMPMQWTVHTEVLRSRPPHCG